MQETKPDVPQLQFVGGAVEVPFSVDVWPGVVLAGTVRPPTAAEVQDYDRAVKAAKDPAARRCEFYARHLKTWNFPEPPTAETIARVPVAVFALLESVVVAGVGCTMTADDITGKSAA